MESKEGKCLDLKVRSYVDGRARESTLGPSHEITERLFVFRRALRMNDTLPGIRRLRQVGCGNVEMAAGDSECPSPVWERRPVRVTFGPAENQNTTYSVRGHAADLVSDEAEEALAETGEATGPDFCLT